MFPSPPSELISPSSQPQELSGLPPDIEPEEERSWFYYLAEISYRRMMNRAVVILRRNGENDWIRDIASTLKRSDDLDEQIKEWCSHIPPQINLDNWEVSNNELACYVRNRMLSSREWIRRPLVYYLVHQPPDDPFATRVNYHHRHHGTWFAARNSATRALILLSAARSGNARMPQQWKEAVNIARKFLQYWSGEAPDLQRAASVLEIIAEEIGMELAVD
ncbi:hypothetical protein Daesc_005381 [Daldinia eschscholtzii]|uniref:Uncharacterized protein n=1 Tax=Daldinia eschscholtzii TaxID=292717 RepID=A0AAX6MLL7_9PEZI